MTLGRRGGYKLQMESRRLVETTGINESWLWEDMINHRDRNTDNSMLNDHFTRRISISEIQ